MKIFPERSDRRFVDFTREEGKKKKKKKNIPPHSS